MMAQRKECDAEWYEIAGLCMPQRGRSIVENHKGKHKSASVKSNLYDGHSIRSFEICGNGMLSGLSSRSRPWFKPKLADDDLNQYYPVRLWLSQVGDLLYTAFSLSNFYEAALSCYMEMAVFGTGACIMQKHDSLISVTHPLTAGEYSISVGEDRRPDSLCRSYTLTARQMVATYAADRYDSKTLHWDRVSRQVKEAWDGGNYERAFVVNQLIEPNPAYVPGKIGRISMPIRSMKWESDCDDKKRFLAIEGYHEQPFMAPRWETIGGDIFGTGRGKKALPDMRALQLQSKRKGEATDMAVKPPTWGPPSIDRVSMLPGQHTTVAAVDMTQGIQPIYEIPYQVIAAINADVDDARRAIDRMTYADLFMAITNMDGVQPRNVEELVRRHEEQLTQLGPVTDRANSEFLQIGFDRMFGLLERGGLLPPAPEEIEGMEIQVDFTSVLAQAQKMLGISQTERAVSFVGNMAGAWPEALDNVDADAIVRDYWDRSGAPATGLRDERQRDKLRSDRARQQQMAQAAAMAPAMQQGADAARLLSEADTGDGGNLLQRLTGG
ncbi:hypothetical protein YP76_04785 [Sphingobium chungbukense]|uniref:Phage tail protein n=2 Tax=Sphingobium chungbukense TaxID=56193 RepID=A0A0M3B069_9SPHN|nr:hypothetical protein YP76_04785 [Sphingobium chungbukense]